MTKKTFQVSSVYRKGKKHLIHELSYEVDNRLHAGKRLQVPSSVPPSEDKKRWSLPQLQWYKSESTVAGEKVFLSTLKRTEWL